METSPLVGGFSALIDVIQAEYGWTDHEVLSLPLARVNQVRDAIYIRSQSEMYARHLEIEWQIKHLALTMVNTMVTDNVKFKKEQAKLILAWDMDKVPEAEETLDQNLDEESIERMWAQGAEKAAAANAGKASFGSLRLTN